MNGTGQAFALLSRCRQAFRPALTSTKALKSICLAECQAIRTYSDQKNDGNNDSYPKLPVESPLSFANDVVKRGFKQVHWCTSELEMERDDILNVNEAAEKILIFATECLAKEDFETLEEKFTPEALEKARTFVALLPQDERKALVFDGTSTSIFASKYTFFFPWNYSAVGNSVNLSYIGFQFYTTSFRQSLWIISMAIPKEGKTISEDWKVQDFYFETFMPPPEQ